MRAHVIALLSVAVLGGVAGSGQSVVGTVAKVDRDQLELKGPNGPVAFHLGEKAAVRKGQTFHDFSALKVGDEVRVNYYGDQDLTAVDVSAKVEISGTITEASSGRLLILPASSRAQSASAKKPVFVYLGRTTKFGTSRNQVAVGRNVHVVGWDAGDGVVDAEKVAVYETDIPARRPVR